MESKRILFQELSENELQHTNGGEVVCVLVCIDGIVTYQYINVD